jgi:hypothetical protein
MTEHHLLYWIFKASSIRVYDLHEIKRAPDLVEIDFQMVKAPDWVWPSYQEALEEYERIV